MFVLRLDTSSLACKQALNAGAEIVTDLKAGLAKAHAIRPVLEDLRLNAAVIGLMQFIDYNELRVTRK